MTSNGSIPTWTTPIVVMPTLGTVMTSGNIASTTLNMNNQNITNGGSISGTSGGFSSNVSLTNALPKINSTSATNPLLIESGVGQGITLKTNGISGTSTTLSSGGILTLAQPPIMSGASITTSTIPILSVAGTAMDLTTGQTVGGTKIFTNTISGSINGTANKATNIVGGLGGSIPYQSAVDTTILLANGNAGQVLTSAGTTSPPTWTTPVVSSTPSLSAVMAVGNSASIGLNMNNNTVSGVSFLDVDGTSTFGNTMLFDSAVVAQRQITSSYYNFGGTVAGAPVYCGRIYGDIGVIVYDSPSALSLSSHIFYTQNTNVTKSSLTIGYNTLQVGTGIELNMGSGNITNAGSITATNFNGTISNATNSTNATITTTSGNTAFNLNMTNGITGNLGIGANAGLTYNPATAQLTTGALSGNGGTFGISNLGINAIQVTSAGAVNLLTPTAVSTSITMPTLASTNSSTNGATTAFVSQIPYLPKTSSQGIFEFIGGTTYGAENLSASALAVATTQAFLLGVYLTKGSILGRYIYFQSASGTAVTFRCAMYNQNFALIAGTDTLTWNSTSSGTVGVPTVQVLASPWTVPTTSNYYIYCNPNVAIATNRIYSLAPNGALANMFNLSSDINPTLLGASQRFRSGLVSGLTASTAPPASLVGLTATLNTQPPYLMLTN